MTFSARAVFSVPVQQCPKVLPCPCLVRAALSSYAPPRFSSPQPPRLAPAPRAPRLHKGDAGGVASLGSTLFVRVTSPDVHLAQLLQRAVFLWGGRGSGGRVPHERGGMTSRRVRQQQQRQHRRQQWWWCDDGSWRARGHLQLQNCIVHRINGRRSGGVRKGKCVVCRVGGVAHRGGSRRRKLEHARWRGGKPGIQACTRLPCSAALQLCSSADPGMPTLCSTMVRMPQARVPPHSLNWSKVSGSSLKSQPVAGGERRLGRLQHTRCGCHGTAHPRSKAPRGPPAVDRGQCGHKHTVAHFLLISTSPSPVSLSA